MNIRSTEFASTFVLFALILLGFYLSSLIDLSLSSDLATFTGPRAYPRFILGVMLFLILVQVTQIIYKIYKEKNIEPNSASNIATSGTSRRQYLKVLFALIALTIFSFFFETLGYIVTIPLLMIAVAALNGSNRLFPNILFSTIAAMVCLVIFRYGLNTVLPEGILGIDQLF